MIASLPMYDYDAVRADTDALWRAIAQRLGIAVTLSRDADHKVAWGKPGLVLSQTCGYPFTHDFRGRLRLVATPHYTVDGCAGPDYCSMIFAREARQLSDFEGARAAINDTDSMSGMLALKLMFVPYARERKFFGEVVLTGGHTKSIMAVRDGRADICAIDAVCAAFTKRYLPHLMDGLVEIARSPMVPGLPFVTAAAASDADIDRLRRALSDVFADPGLAMTRERLFLGGLSFLDESAYERILVLERDMEAAGGLSL